MQSRIPVGVALGALVVLAGASALTGCDSGPSALPARDHSAAALDQAARAVEARPPATAAATRAAADTPLYRGRPIWAANRKHSAQENADYQFKRNGADFGARSVDDFVAKAHAFVNDPPKGAQTIKRSNGDVLIYEPRANVFAVASKDGAPRTMFKPDTGKAYWDEQKAKEAKLASGRSRKDDDA